MKSSNIGGQAVIEGIMMKNAGRYAVAVRKPDKTIEVKTWEYKHFIGIKMLTTMPIVRGVFNFIDSMVLGMKTLTYSASFMEDEEEESSSKAEKLMDSIFKEKAEKVLMGITVAFSIIMAVGIFMILPYFISTIFHRFTDSATLIAVAEGIVRIALFVSYVLLISLMKDIQRVFMYHGAEHKCINCIEHGLDLNVPNVMKSSKQHKRCGTSFMLIVMVISVIFFIFIRVDTPLLRVIIRILLVPVIAGVSYEFIKLAGKSENKLVTILSKPGMWLQNLTTREPDASIVEVAIASVEAVFDWKSYLNENFGTAYEIKAIEIETTKIPGQLVGDCAK